MSERVARADDIAQSTGVVEYKEILQRVLEARPSGTRQRIAAALNKNRSFVTQITSTAYDTPIPARHVDLILEICHFSPSEREAFLAAYARAHPSRHAPPHNQPRTRTHVIHLPDLGSEAKNRQLDQLIGDFIEKLANIVARAKD